jgi:hypothetical protein
MTTTVAMAALMRARVAGVDRKCAGWSPKL